MACKRKARAGTSSGSPLESRKLRQTEGFGKTPKRNPPHLFSGRLIEDKICSPFYLCWLSIFEPQKDNSVTLEIWKEELTLVLKFLYDLVLNTAILIPFSNCKEIMIPRSVGSAFGVNVLGFCSCTKEISPSIFHFFSL
ncbi:uncharacterized protein LOC125470683 [Pyrus x bretschneideri]|uniref:uncharacterized protein LOC125470683 n=1 Tax=Pyrus x bretschneideri TaxID=225117 RepID=UPI00202E97DA|nr:uncharacterized protein LOC125470683 [Pyrus x bretschneideri]